MPLKNNRDKLIETTKNGGITLVLGAGVSRAVGVPSWEDLAKKMWEVAFPEKESPWDAPEDKSPRSLPQFLPIVFEMTLQELKEEKFIEALQDCLYENVKYLISGNSHRSKSTLEVIARLILQEHGARGRRRLVRVITFNVDSLLEQAVFRLKGAYGKQASEGFARAGRQRRWARGDEPIPIYHLHGFIPRKGRQGKHRAWVKNYDHMLVFTDSQYWNSGSKMLSFANHIMGYTLHDSHCVFVGLSMTDINLLRWLALRRNELMAEAEEISEKHPDKRKLQHPNKEPPLYLMGLKRHFWIRPKSDDPTGFLTKFLETRGVRSVEIRSWKGTSFENLISKCFPLDE